jgi:hypothetical protein
MAVPTKPITLLRLCGLLSLVVVLVLACLFTVAAAAHQSREENPRAREFTSSVSVAVGALNTYLDYPHSRTDSHTAVQALATLRGMKASKAGGRVLIDASRLCKGITLVGRKTQHVLRGTSCDDKLFGHGGDHIYGLAGNDYIVAGAAGPNYVFAGPGNDIVQARNGVRDHIDCGSGHNTAVVDNIDVVARNCQVVLRPGSKTGTRAHPIPEGAAAYIGQGWTIKVVSTLPNATARVLQFDRSNNPPGRGKQFYMVQISATLRGKKPRYFSAAYRIRAVGRQGAGYTPTDNSCGSIPDPDLEVDNRQIFPPNHIQGNVCWNVLSSDAPNLLMYTDDQNGGIKRLYFALHS